MRLRSRALAGAIAVLLALGIAGCTATGDPAAPSSAPADHSHTDDAHDHDHDEVEPAAPDALPGSTADQVVAVAMANFRYEPTEIRAGAGDVLEIVFTNTGDVLHDFSIETIPADVHVSELSDEPQGEHEHVHPLPEAHIALDPGGSGMLHLKVHEPGEYVFYCTVPGHRELGMEGRLIVE